MKELKSIGIIHTPYKSDGEAPYQAYKSEEIGEIEVFKEYEKGLKDIEGFSHLIILYLFNKSKGYSLLVRPFLDENLRGLFATRSPSRPNPIGLTIVELLECNGNILRVRGVDMLDGTPLLDIKPHVPEFDRKIGVKIGWLEGKV